MRGGSELGWEVSQLTSTTRPFGPASIIMPRQRSNATDEKDARVKVALDAYLEKKYNQSLRWPKHSTLQFQTFNSQASHQGRQTRVQSHEQQQVLITAEEDELVRWITQLTVISSAPSLLLV